MQQTTTTLTTTTTTLVNRTSNIKDINLHNELNSSKDQQEIFFHEIKTLILQLQNYPSNYLNFKNQ